MPGLTDLDISMCPDVTDAGITAIALGPTSLTWLTFASCDATDLGVTAISEGLICLTHLNISFCVKVTDLGITAIANGLRSLSDLLFRHCQVTGAGVEAIVYRLTNLTQLDLSGFEYVRHGCGSLRHPVPPDQLDTARPLVLPQDHRC
eukprot:TRINITY_DN26599_c0_g1_i1.p1 TRINITY_DN26599_c0_g1~~TRINITY_DN26599_c0_g1_i1.p1  ORF type:complete len:148 (+),score=12.67 TRINITY_DN26599_c0_g1_i1:323-766(+)